MKKNLSTSTGKILEDVELLLSQKKFEAALEILEDVTKKTNLNYKLYFYYGVCLLQLNQIKKSIIYFSKVEKLQPDFLVAKINHSLALQRLGKLNESIRLSEKILSMDPNNSVAWFNKGISNQKLDKFEESIKCFQETVRLNNKHLKAWFNLGVSYFKKRNYEKSIENFKKTISLDENYTQAWFYMGIALSESRNYISSISAFDKTEKQNPNMKILWKYKAKTYHEMMIYDKAEINIKKYIKTFPDDINGLLIYCAISKKFNKMREAIKAYERIRKIDKNNYSILGHLIFAKLCICDWHKFDELLNDLSLAIKKNKNASAPLILSYLPLSSDLLKNNAEAYTKDTTFKIKDLEGFKKNEQKSKIKIAYISGDYRIHPIGMQMIEVLKHHNHKKFDITGVSIGPNTNDAVNQTLKKLFQNFVDIEKTSDLKSIKLLRNYNFDIVVYLSGFTEYTRINLLKNRIAKIQINHQGHPGCMTKDLVDYTIADKIIVPESKKKFYSEKIIYLPHHYKACFRTTSTQKLENNRKNYNLPENKFIFCCFHNNFKITPDLFNSWVRILKNTNESVLWLIDNGIPEFKQNLKNILKKESINSERLIFAKRVNHDRYFERLKLANLFLDTFYYNAAATASDALWSGLPMITLKGKNFASRVGASLLENLNVPELVTNSKNEYENLAIKLVKNKKKLKDIKSKILTNIESSTPFNNKEYVLNLERLYQNVLQDNK